jgi:hypothetical protein
MGQTTTAAAIGLVFVLSAACPAWVGQEKRHTAPALVPNEWVKLNTASLGCVRSGKCGRMRGPALLYVPPLDCFLAALGAQNRFDRQTPCYSETTLRLDTGVWENSYPQGKDWGPAVGPAEKAPTLGEYGRGLKRGEDGILRPHLRGGYGMPVWHQYCWDSHRRKAVFLFEDELIEYDPVERVWSPLPAENNPVAARLPGAPVETGSALHWGALCYDPVNREVLLFGGASTITERGDAGTWTYRIADKTWRRVARGTEAMRALHARAEALRSKAHHLLTACRNRYYRTERAEDAKQALPALLRSALDRAETEAVVDAVRSRLASTDGYEKTQLQRARADLAEAIPLHIALVEAAAEGADRDLIRAARTLESRFRRAAISLAPQPPPRCFSPMVFDAETGTIVLFGGSHLDRCLADTWVYDTRTRTWRERRPPVGPSPRHGHGLLYLPRAGRVALVGGWQSRLESHPALPPELWTYDVAANRWGLVTWWETKGPFDAIPYRPSHSNAVPFAVDRGDTVVLHHTSGTWACRLDVETVDEAGTDARGVKPGTERLLAEGEEPYSPGWYDSAPTPDTATIEKMTERLKANTWVAAPQGGRHRPRFAYSTVACDPDRDQILVWAGGHATTHQTVVSRYSLATGTWHIDYPPQLGMSYGRKLWGRNYAYGYRPFMPRHPWDGYAYDPPSGKLLVLRTTGPLTLVFDPDKGDFDRPAMSVPPHGGDSTATMGSSPDGALLWVDRILYRFDHEKARWTRLPVTDGTVPKSVFYDGIVYDARRKNYVLFSKPATYGKEKQVYRYDPATGSIVRMKPAHPEKAPDFLREMTYIPDADLFFHGTGACWDPRTNRWAALGVDHQAIEDIGANDGMCWDAKRGLLWLVKGYERAVFVMKPDFETVR